MAFVDAYISDLFFNHANENVREILGENFTRDEFLVALRKDAREFVLIAGEFSDVTVEELVEDFDRRL